MAGAFAIPDFGASGLNAARDVLREAADKVKAGDLSDMELMLAAQTIALNAVFSDMAWRAAENVGKYLLATETYLRLAFKAQAQCRAPATFASWFQSGTPAVNGVVNPANSVAFPASPNCSFYQWSEQMFRWLTSPAPSIYGGGDHIFNSQVFSDVTPPDPSGNRTLLPHSSGFVHAFGVRAAQLGPHGLPVIVAKSGQILEIERPQAGVGTQLSIRDANGNLVDVVHAELDANHALILHDKTRAVIRTRTLGTGRPVFRAPTSGTAQVQKFIIDNVPIFIDPFGNVIEVEQGQADGSVLQAQNGSLIYYGIMVNDVYAYFLTGLKDGTIEPGNPNPTFPTTMSDLGAITSFAASHGITLVDAAALAVEVKTSWVEASSLPSNASGYITTTAVVPTYNTSSTTDWKPTSTETIQLALVSMHVVGSTAGHPEMIWASFIALALGWGEGPTAGFPDQRHDNWAAEKPSGGVRQAAMFRHRKW